MNNCPWYTNNCERYDCYECELYNVVEEENKEEENKEKENDI